MRTGSGGVAGGAPSSEVEDGAIALLLEKIGETNRFCVEFGAGDGKMDSNTWLLRERGWGSVLLDGAARGPGVIQQRLTAENINDVFTNCSVHKSINVLSIDVDGNDYWIWRALDQDRFRARIIVIEFNPHIPSGTAIAIQYNLTHQWDGTSYYGASLTAMERLGTSRGYRLVGSVCVNAFFVLGEIAESAGLERTAAQMVHPTPVFFHPVDTLQRPWVWLDERMDS